VAPSISDSLILFADEAGSWQVGVVHPARNRTAVLHFGLGHRQKPTSNYLKLLIF
jgi:hypothetical protein